MRRASNKFVNSGDPQCQDALSLLLQCCITSVHMTASFPWEVPSVTLLQQLTEFPHLTSLNFDGPIPWNSIRTGVADFYKRISSLSIHSSGYSDSAEVGSLLQQFQGLSSLNISKCSLRELGVGLFAAMTALTTLDVSENLLTDLDTGAFSGLTRLERLYCGRNHGMTALPDTIFDNLPSLQVWQRLQLRLAR